MTASSCCCRLSPWLLALLIPQHSSAKASTFVTFGCKGCGFDSSSGLLTCSKLNCPPRPLTGDPSRSSPASRLMPSWLWFGEDGWMGWWIPAGSARMRFPVAECVMFVSPTQAHTAGLPSLQGIFADACKMHPGIAGPGRITSVH